MKKIDGRKENIFGQEDIFGQEGHYNPRKSVLAEINLFMNGIF